MAGTLAPQDQLCSHFLCWHSVAKGLVFPTLRRQPIFLVLLNSLYFNSTASNLTEPDRAPVLTKLRGTRIAKMQPRQTNQYWQQREAELGCRFN